MPISVEQWRVSVGIANASRSLRSHMARQSMRKLAPWNTLLFLLTAPLGAILLPSMMPISANQWHASVGVTKIFQSLWCYVTGQSKRMLTSWDILVFFTALLGAILIPGHWGREIECKIYMFRGSGGCGTMGELAPSLLTAPWRKELLMLAGDVEINPGPTAHGVLTMSDLDTLVKETSTISGKWKSIGQELFIPAHQKYLIDIRNSFSTSHDCFREVLRKWLQEYPPTWGRIIATLRKVGEPVLADHLKEKYIPDLLEMSDLDLLTQELSGVKHKWESIGKGLELDTYAIPILYSDDGDRLREVLSKQLQRYYTTWRNIVAVLRNLRVGEYQLADQLEYPTPPKIIQHPKSHSVPTGAETTFKIEATGSSITFQWQKDENDVHNDINFSGTDTNVIRIQRVKKSDEGHYRCIVKNRMTKARELSDEANLTVSCLHDVEVVDITPFTYSGMAKDFEMKEFGYKLHFPDHALPPDVDECKVHVESSRCGPFKLPVNMELTSGIYWITSTHSFTKPVTIEFQHCAKPEHLQNLTFIRSKHILGNDCYKFNVLDGGVFSPGTQYGSISLMQFSGVGIALQLPAQQQSLIHRLCCRHQPESDVKSYCARLYYCCSGIHSWEVYFTITQNLKLHITATIDAMRTTTAAKLQVGPHQNVAFAGDEITLDVAREGITLENGWRITPFTHPGITKEQVNNFVPNCEDPNYCQLNVKWIGQQEQPEELMHRVKLLGAKEPFDFFVIRLPPDLELSPSHVAGDERPNMPKLLSFPGKGGTKINIPQRIGTKYFQLGVQLLNDETGEEIDAVVSKCREDAEQINFEILKLWVRGKGKPLSWDVLINVLKDVGLGTLASDIKDGLSD